MKKQFGLFVVSGLMLVGCSNGADSVKQDLKQSLVANQAAESSDEWDGSESNPERLFPKWRQMVAEQSLTPEEVCQALDSMDDGELSLMEVNISSAENEDLVNTCKDHLLARIENYFLDQREDVSANLDNFFQDEVVQRAQSVKKVESTSKGIKFPDLVEYRDTSTGYYARTGDVKPGHVVLTFDDGPAKSTTEVILKTLKEVNAKAIFFQVGKNVRANPALVKQVAAEGHALAAHSMTHRCLAPTEACRKNNGGIMLSTDQAMQEVRGSLNEILNVTGEMEPFFRFPYGAFDKRLDSRLGSQGIANFFWNVDTMDWSGIGKWNIQPKSWQDKKIKELVDDTIRKVNAQGRGVILFHDIHRRTAEALPEILKQLHEGGYKIVLLKSKTPLRKTVGPLP